MIGRPSSLFPSGSSAPLRCWRTAEGLAEGGARCRGRGRLGWGLSWRVASGLARPLVQALVFLSRSRPEDWAEAMGTRASPSGVEPSLSGVL